jgi:hypothetical protein
MRSTDRQNQVSPERRKYPRIDTVGGIQGHIVTQDKPIAILEMSLGGFSIETTVSFPLGAIHYFRLTPAHGGEPLMVSARVIHSLHASGPDGSAHYFTGFKFVTDEAQRGLRAIKEFVGALPN